MPSPLYGEGRDGAERGERGGESLIGEGERRGKTTQVGGLLANSYHRLTAARYVYRSTRKEGRRGALGGGGEVERELPVSSSLDLSYLCGRGLATGGGSAVGGGRKKKEER